ncbi:PREDICTED: uncharacterized protein LOC108759463 [Trachymyrmex cornetzi]|uniref:uncharacterized protein LOC108759463 n=1 Tax=Trachymyrmex cornetzi TaxID=471704 RepID=UPI00084F66D7|nr:PREDICTED: uncharacterized protein LOC108759463 [Trachymyrmex cornetzi]
MLLGALVFWSILQQGRKQQSEEQPVFQNTKLGWLLGGKHTPIRTTDTKICVISNENLDEQLEKFWAIERCELERKLTPEEQACEEYFAATTYRDEEGRFVIPLPFKEEAQSRESIREQSGKKAPNNRTDIWSSCKKDMVHMELIPENNEEPAVVNYLPHHGVTREESSTTKFRVVFDASY